MALRRIRAFGSCFDIEVNRSKDGKINIAVSDGTKTKTYKVKAGQTISYKF